jgi:hypothetical protein
MKNHSPTPETALGFQPTAVSVKPAKAGRRLRKALQIGSVIIVLLLAWIAIDLFVPRSTSLRQFDAAEMARLDTAMWRSYYDKERFLLFRQLTELMQQQYRMPFFRAHATAFRAAKAAFVFKDGKGRSDYEKALPDLVKFYGAIHQMGDIDFNIERAAKLELEWWIVHRERKRHAPGDLERTLAEAAAEIYQVPASSLTDYARLRTEAMLIRDDKAEYQSLTEHDWQHIDELLQTSWTSLHQAVNR